MARRRTHITELLAAGLAMLALCVCTACGGGSGSGGGETISGAAFEAAPAVRTVSFDDGAATKGPSCAIDTSHANQGYAAAKGTSSSRLKLQVTMGERSYNYDIPTDGSPLYVPINMGDGTYNFRIMQNTSGSNYVEIASTTAEVKLENEFDPFLYPNVFCNFDESSASTALARELTADSATQADALKAICTWVTDNISYDSAKAEELSTTTGYVPNPDDTLAAKTGICFDYASLGAAMLRSVGIPARVITGYVSPNDLYHAWIAVYIDGTWITAEFKVNSNEWSRVDLTFAASSGDGKFVGDGKTYTDRYTY